MWTRSPTISAAPIGFIEGVHHEVFKFWRGEAVDLAREMVLRAMDPVQKRAPIPSGQLRNACAGCINDPFNIFCMCCKVGSISETLQHVVGNQLIPFCDEERYYNSGLFCLPGYDEVMPNNVNEVELCNIRSILSEKHTWEKTITLVYGRRHWASVYAYAQELMRRWSNFFTELRNRTEPFAGHEQEQWNELLFSAPEDGEYEFLYNIDDTASIKKTAIHFYVIHVVKEYTDQGRQDISLENIPAACAKLEKELHDCPYADIYFPWSWDREPEDKTARGRFVDQLVYKREETRRLTNISRRRMKHRLSSVPPNRLGAVPMDDIQGIKFPERDVRLIEYLTRDSQFDFEEYWPILLEYTIGFYKCLFVIPLGQLENVLGEICIDAGQIYNAQLRMRQFEPYATPTQLLAEVERSVSFTAIAVEVPGNPQSIEFLQTSVRIALQNYLATNHLEMTTSLELNVTTFVLIEFGGAIASEVKLNDWQLLK